MGNASAKRDLGESLDNADVRFDGVAAALSGEGAARFLPGLFDPEFNLGVLRYASLSSLKDIVRGQPEKATQEILDDVRGRW